MHAKVSTPATSSSSSSDVGSSWWLQTKMDHPTMMQFIPGAAQGATQVFLGHPIDTVKTRIQSATTEIEYGSSKRWRNSGSGTLSVLRQTVREEGFTSLYRGVTPPLLLTAAKRSLQFALWENLHDFFENTSFANLAPGAIAGFCGTVVGCPIHVVKIQTQNSRAHQTRNALTCFRDILRNEGVRGLYRGMYAQIIKDTCFAAVYLGLYGMWRDHYIASHPPAAVTTEKKEGGEASAVTVGTPPPIFSSENSYLHWVDSKVFGTFLAGTMASTCTWVLLAPLDTFKTFVQSKRSPMELFESLRSLQKSSNSGTSTKSVARVLWRGLPAALIRSGPVAGCAMIAYEGSRSFLEVPHQEGRGIGNSRSSVEEQHHVIGRVS